MPRKLRQTYEITYMIGQAMYLKVHNLMVCMSGLTEKNVSVLGFWSPEGPRTNPCRRGGNTVLHRKNMTPFPITRMAFSITTVENFSANMLNEGFPGGSVVKNLFANVEDTGDAGSIPGWRRSLGEGNGNPLQDSCLENFTDRGAWQAKVHEVAKRGMWLSMHAYTNHMLNEIPQGKNYLWDFLSLFPSLLKYQSTTISSRTLWSTLQQMPAPSSNTPAPTVTPKGLSSSLWSLLGESPWTLLSNTEVTLKHCSLAPGIPKHPDSQTRLLILSNWVRNQRLQLKMHMVLGDFLLFLLKPALLQNFSH